MTTFARRYLDNRYGYGSHLYKKNPANKLYEDDTTARTGNFESNAVILKLIELAKNSKRPDTGSTFGTVGMSWNRPSRKRNWEDDQWIEAPDSDKDNGSTS